MSEDLKGSATWSAPLAGVQQELLSAHFLLLTRLLRKSAQPDFAQFEPQNLLERRILLTLHRIEEGRSSEIANLLGNDVAQISRALRSMCAAGLVDHERQRDPYRLTAAGYELSGALDEVARRRDAELTRGLSPQQMFELAGLMTHLLQKASSILAEETAKAKEGAVESQRPASPAALEAHSRVHSAIVSLAITIGRSATLAFKRLASVSNYEWRILANVAYRPSISFMELVNHLDSDKAQVSRTLDALVRNGLLRRIKGKGGEPARFELTEEGHRRHDIMQADALRRNALLTAGVKNEQRRRLLGYVDLLISNAAAMAGLEN